MPAKAPAGHKIDPSNYENMRLAWLTSYHTYRRNPDVLTTLLGEITAVTLLCTAQRAETSV